MGCLNSNQGFSHWFGNIHLSGGCNRSCYFCVGQHMMALDPLNNLDEWPLSNIGQFVEDCLGKGIAEVDVTGSNTDPLLYKHTDRLANYLRERIPGLVLGLRTNGACTYGHEKVWALYDKGSVSVTSLREDIHRATMGQGKPANFWSILDVAPFLPKVNVILCPETCIQSEDLRETIMSLSAWGIERVNLREPYGQPHIGDPMPQLGFGQVDTVLGMPVYEYENSRVTYWDVHYVEVESINLYANGRVSLAYPITKGHCDTTGEVLDQSFFRTSGRVRDQWAS